MVFPNKLLEDLPAEPPPSEDAPPPSDGGDGGDQTPPPDGGGGDGGGDNPPPEPPPSDGSPPPSDGSGDGSGDGSQGQQLGPPEPGTGGVSPTDLAGEPAGPQPEMPQPSGNEPAPSSPPEGQTPPEKQPVPEHPNVNIPGLQGILDWLHNAIQSVEDQISTITQTIGDSLGAMIESVIPPTVAAITGIASIIGNLVEGLLNNLAPITDVGQMAQDALTGGIPLAMQSFVDTIWEQRGDSISQFLETIVNNDELPDNIKAPFAAIHGGTSPIEKLLGLFGMAGLLAAVGGTILSPVLEKARQGANIEFRPTIADLDTLNDLYIRQQIDSATYNTGVGRLGFPDQWIDILRNAQFVNIPVGEIQEARRRGMLSDDQYTAMLNLHGFQDTQSALFDQLRWQVPTYTDLVHFMTRDAFFDSDDSPFGNVVRDFQLDFGEDALPFDQAAQAGVPEQMLRWAWRAHWEIPGRHDANEMFFRGQLGDRSPGGEGEAVLRRVYRARGIEPRFIEPLVSTAFHPIGRIDIRRLVKNGTLDRDGAVESYQQLGYNNENAGLLADLAITLATQESASEREPYRSGLKQRIVAAYIQGTLDASDTQKALLDLGYDEAATSAFISEAEVERHAQISAHIREGVQRLYTSGEWDKDTASGYLGSKGFSDTEIGRLFEWWEPLRDLSDLKAEHKAHKEATRGDIINAFRDDIIDRDTAHDHLSAIGYSDDDIAMLLDSAAFHKSRSDITAEIEGVHAAFTDRQIDEQEAMHELDQLNVNGNRRNALLRKWMAELDRKQPDLPLTMVEKLATAKLYTFDELTEELQRRHFSNAQVDKFRKLWGYEIEVAAERSKTQSQREQDAIQRRNEADKRRQEAEARRDAAHAEAERRHAEAEARRAIADSRRAEADQRREQRAAQAEHDRMVREAHSGRLSIGRIRTAYTLGVISQDQAENLMLALGLRPETVQLEMEIINEQLRAKSIATASPNNSTSVSQTTATITR